MADYSVPAADIGVHLKKMTANQIDKVTFVGRDLSEVEVLTDGASDIFVRIGTGDPTVAGGNCWRIPAAMGNAIIPVDTSGDTVVKMVSAGTPTYSVSRTR